MNSNNLYENLTETQCLKLVQSYINQTIEPVYILEDDVELDGLEVEDVHLIPRELFKKDEWNKEQIKELSAVLSRIITRREEEDLKELNAEL
jgi:hypothetical protein